MSTWTRWQDWVGVVLGVLLFITPFVFGGMVSTGAEWTAFICGVLLVILGLIDLANPANRTGEWAEGVLGVLLAGSVLFGGEAQRPAMVGQR